MRPAPFVLIALLAALVLGVNARDLRPAPFGDELVARSAPAGPADALRRGADRSVQAYDTRSGRPVWSYRRPGRTPLGLVTVAGTTVAVWDDGMLTGVRPDQAAVRWHRFVPGLAAWLVRLRRAHGLDRGVLLAPLGGGGTASGWAAGLGPPRPPPRAAGRRGGGGLVGIGEPPRLRPSLLDLRSGLPPLPPTRA